jgi:hypothetical protein
VTDEAESPGADEAAPDLDEAEPARYSDDEEDSIKTGADGGASQTLMALLSRHPFSSLYQATGGNKDHLDVRGWVCFILDLMFVLVVVSLLLGIIAAVAWKTLAPVPTFWTH